MVATRSQTVPSTERVWRALDGALRAFIARRVQDPTERKHVLRDTFVHVDREVESLRVEERIGAWLYQVALSCVAEHHRKQSGGALLFDAFTPPPPDDEEEVRQELASWMVPSVETLADTYRDALLLAELDDVPQGEVAKRLGLSLSSAKSRIHGGRQRLQELLKACCKHEHALVA